METYEFFYMTQKASFTFIESRLDYKIGLKKGSIDFSEIIFFRKFEYQDYDHFIIRYKNDKGKVKNLKSFADKGSEGLNPLIFRLAEIFPEKDLSHTPVAKARKLMKVQNVAKIGFWGAAIIVLAIVVFIFRDIFKDPSGSMPLIIIGGIILFILVIAFAVVFFQGKNESKDWD